VNKKAIGSISGIVGAGGNAGAVAAGFLFKSENISYQQALFILGIVVAVSSFAAFLVHFDAKSEAEAKAEMDQLLKVPEQEGVLEMV
jgi:NNP family nitrate/nitrite transporter-like MFS transporter